MIKQRVESFYKYRDRTPEEGLRNYLEDNPNMKVVSISYKPTSVTRRNIGDFNSISGSLIAVFEEQAEGGEK